MVDSNFCMQQSFPHNTELCFSNTETKLSSSLRSVCSNQAAYFVNLYYMPHLYSFEFIMHSSPPPELICCILFIYCGRHEVAPAVAAAKSLQSCPTLCNPRDGNPPGSPVPGILQARTQEWVAISFSNAWKWKVRVKSLSHVWLFATPLTAAHQAPPSMGFSRQEYWSGVPSPFPNLQF